MRVPEEGCRWLTYRELTVKLAAYCREMGFTHDHHHRAVSDS